MNQFLKKKSVMKPGRSSGECVTYIGFIIDRLRSVLIEVKLRIYWRSGVAAILVNSVLAEKYRSRIFSNSSFSCVGFFS